VMAQVKLGFFDAVGTKYAITRSMQLTAKKNASSFKTLDGTLVLIKDGERIVISARTAEMVKVVPRYLGVSPAVLENVMFCHQEESLWPMSEPAALKKKFDEIFEAMKYTKAIDNLKKLRKAQADELKILKVREEQDKFNKDKGKRVETYSRTLVDEIDILQQKAKVINDELIVAKQEAKDKRILANRALNIVNELEAKKGQEAFLQEQVVSLRKGLVVRPESDEHLRTHLAQYEHQLAQYKQQNQENQRTYKELTDTLSNSREQMSKKQKEMGQLQAEKENYERQLQDRAYLVKEAARQHSMRGYDGDLDEDEIREFVSRVRKLSKDKDRELQRLQASLDEEARKTQAAITEIQENQATLKQQKKTARQAIDENSRKSEPLQRDLNSVRMDEGAMVALEASFKDLQDRLRNSTAEYESADWDGSLKTERGKLRELEAESNRLASEIFQSNKLAADRADFEHVKKLAKKAQQGLDAMLINHRDQLNSIIGLDWQVGSLEREFQAIIDQRNRSVADAQKQQEGTIRELGEVQSKLRTVRDILRKKKENMKQYEATVLNSISTPEGAPLTSVDDFPEELADLEKVRNDIQKEIDGFQHKTVFFTQCLEEISSHNQCKLCERKFADKKEQSRALEKIKKRLEKNAKATLEDELQQFEADLQKAVAARPKYEAFKTMFEIELPELEKDLQKTQQREDELNRILQRHDGLFNQEVLAKKEVELLTKTVSAISGYYTEIVKHEADIARLSSQQKISGSSLTIEEMGEQQSECSEQIRVSKVKIEKLVAEKELAKNTMNSLQMEVNSASNKLSSAQHELEKKTRLLSQLEGLRENTRQQHDNIQKADSRLEALVPQLEEAHTRHTDTKQRGRDKEREVQVDKDSLADTVNKFKLAETAINRYIEEEGPQRLAACHRAIKTLEKDQKRINEEIEDFTQKSNELIKIIQDSDRDKKTIEDNIRYRDTLSKLNAIKEDITGLNTRNSTDDFDRLNREAAMAEGRCQNLISEQGPLDGEMRSKDKELAKNIAEWNSDYQHAALQYRTTHIKVETTKAAIEDLGKYQSALDNAVMKFHSVKMEEINRIAGELWQNTYQGTDVDTIMIKSEKENESSVLSTRNYNYRVVMVKSDAEMDMRGRCSAGQKVLASIIIRLALAECFGVQCGVRDVPIPSTKAIAKFLQVMALDEPTTNLDRDTIRSLAQSLHQIIKTRKSQANFQLIVITHDEEFLKEMKCQDFCDTYYRVSRNEKQKSVIEQQSIVGIMG
jgi:DNA repair protein RAD50